jgi:tetratricopeptide (TPR) repeat protein
MRWPLIICALLAAQAEPPPTAPISGGEGAAAAETPGAPPPPPAPEAPAPAAEATLLQRRDAAQEQFVRLADEKRYEEALTLATQIVDLTVQVYGDRSIELAGPLTNLATVQMRRGDLTAAEANYQSSITLIERAEGILSPRLINSLIGLGATYNRAGLYGQATEAYQRALRVNHAEQGFYNRDQFKIRDGLTETYLGLEKLDQANFQQQTQLAIERRRYGDDSAELVPAIEKLARWYDRTGQYVESRLQWANARRILRETKGPNDPGLVDILIGESQSYQGEAFLPSAVRSLKDALEILDAQPTPDHLKRAEVLVSLGDLYLAVNRANSAREHYLQAWDDLSGNDELLAKRDDYFARPRRISGQRLDTVAGDKTGTGPRTRPEAFATGYVVANLAVDEDGRVREPKVIESDPAGFMDAYLLDVLGGSRFRPRIDDGKVVVSEGVVFRHDFQYAKGLAASRSDKTTEDGKESDRGEPIAYPEKPAIEQPPKDAQLD